MIEIAICLAIIGFALVAIILALPFGLNAQRDNRQETIVGQDAAALIELVRDGSHGADDLTNHVFVIVNTGSNSYGGPVGYYNPVLAPQMNFSQSAFSTVPANRWFGVLTNGANIIGLLSTPELVTTNFLPTNNLYSGGYSNHVVAYIRSLSGLAAEQSPQNNSIMIGDTFAYRLYLDNAAPAVDTNLLILNQVPAYAQNLNNSLHELRLTFRWPLSPGTATPDGTGLNQGASPETFRTSIGGNLSIGGYINGTPLDGTLYYYQPQNYTTAP